MDEFLKTLIPWANWYNAGVLSLDLIVIIVFLKRYLITRNRNLLTSMPGLFTSLGILGTFCAICYSLAGISSEPDTISNVGKSIGEVASSTSGSLDLKRIIADLIPAFSTSIYGLILAFFSTFFTKLHFASLDSKLEKKLRYKEPEQALEALDDHILQLTKTNEENNNKLNDSIIAQSQILSEFVKNFMGEMEDTFKAMNATIEQRVSSFGTTQYEQSRQLLEGLTKKLGEDAIDILADHNKSVKTFTDASSAELTAMKEAVTTAVAAFKSDAITGIERLSKEQTAALEKLSEDSLSLHMESLKEQQKFNEDLLGRMSSSLSDTTTRIVNDMAAQISILKGSIETSVLQLKEAYEFITDRSANIVSNYEQATEAYRDAVQNTHDINEKVETGLSEVESSLKAIGQTNDKVGKVIDLIEAKEANMEAIAMRIEALSSAIASLERLESVLSRISAK